MSEKRNAPARLVDSVIEAKVPGSFKPWSSEAPGRVDGITFVCPCGCGDLGSVRFGEGRWTWNGSLASPTVTPSIRQLACGWHGWLTDGEFREC